MSVWSTASNCWDRCARISSVASEKQFERKVTTEDVRLGRTSRSKLE